MIPKKFHPDRDKLIEKGLTEAHGVPAKLISSTYHRIVRHCKKENGLWACAKTGGRIKVKMSFRLIFRRPENAEGKPLFLERAAVGQMYCESCDRVPATMAEEPLWEEEVMSVML